MIQRTRPLTSPAGKCCRGGSVKLTLSVRCWRKRLLSRTKGSGPAGQTNSLNERRGGESCPSFRSDTVVSTCNATLQPHCGLSLLCRAFIGPTVRRQVSDDTIYPGPRPDRRRAHAVHPLCD